MESGVVRPGGGAVQAEGHLLTPCTFVDVPGAHRVDARVSIVSCRNWAFEACLSLKHEAHAFCAFVGSLVWGCVRKGWGRIGGVWGRERG